MTAATRRLEILPQGDASELHAADWSLLARWESDGRRLTATARQSLAYACRSVYPRIYAAGLARPAAWRLAPTREDVAACLGCVVRQEVDGH